MTSRLVSIVTRAAPPSYENRALALWPRLDPIKLRRVRRDPRRIAHLVARRTCLSEEAIVALLTEDLAAGDRSR